MKADDITVEVFDAMLARATFNLLTYPARYGYEGAGPRCLYAAVDDVEILYENGEYTVHGMENEDDFDSMFCVMFTDDGQREQIV